MRYAINKAKTSLKQAKQLKTVIVNLCAVLQLADDKMISGYFFCQAHQTHK